MGIYLLWSCLMKGNAFEKCTSDKGGFSCVDNQSFKDCVKAYEWPAMK